MSSLPRCAAALLLICTAWFPAQAQDPTHRVIAEDYFSLSLMTEIAFAPDGRHVGYVELRWDEEADSRNPDLWVVDIKTRKTKRLTFDGAGDHHPQWSADSKTIFFTSERKDSHLGKNQVWKIAVDGSGLMPVTRAKEGVDSYQVSSDGESLYYTTSNEVVDDPWKDLHQKHDKLQYGHGVTNLSQLWKLNLNTWRSEKLVDDKRVIKDFVVTEDGKRIAMLTTPTPKLIFNEGRSRVDIFNRNSKTVTSLTDKLWRGRLV